MNRTVFSLFVFLFKLQSDDWSLVYVEERIYLVSAWKPALRKLILKNHTNWQLSDEVIFEWNERVEIGAGFKQDGILPCKL